jgi:hypothetical protein
MLISQAEANLHDAIEAYARGEYDTAARQEALQALIADQPCVIATGGYHNQAALRISGAVNRGDAPLADLCLAFGRSRSFGTPAENINLYVLSDLVGVNDLGRALLSSATAQFAPRKAEAA